ncbi:hypothetical protein MLD38_026818 [Melastoma candidum]|nr:hypothetical protein MLD38_026818 [Melastoma candidum]
MYKFMSPMSSGMDDDPKLNPGADPDLEKMAGERALVCVASRDWLKPRGITLYETLRARWGGKLALVETDEDHCFYMFKKNDKADELIAKMVDFISQQ